ncbi:MAG: YkgJ family cysteine cluster protein [Pyrinomonadaceae bacterium]|nr:YkgJ family cysteine cluster protein [Pyrinomonadaceae bacterium]MBP6213841.1 YkgJ family cysteine cluster protein [Pyrinomonadaceae bacterium]
MSELVQITRYSKSDYYELIGDLDRRKKATIFEPQFPLERLSKFVADSVTASAKGPTPECVTCGVCCAFALIVPVRLDDTPPLKAYWDITLDGADEDIVIERVLPRDVETGYCSHLEGELTRSIGCRIYPERPFLCHEFEAGSDRCHEYRRMYGVEARLTEQELASDLANLLNIDAEKSVITFAAIAVDSVSWKASYSIEEPGRMVSAKVTYLRIVAIVDDDLEKEYEVHSYDASEETWFESDLIGMTLPEARQFIETRVNRC